MSKKEFKSEQLKAFRAAAKLLEDPSIEPSLLAGLLGYWGLDWHDPIFKLSQIVFTIPVDDNTELELIYGMRREVLAEAAKQFDVPFRDAAMITVKANGEIITRGYSLCSLSDQPDAYIGAHVALRKASEFFPRETRKTLHEALNKWMDSEVEDNFLEAICLAL